MGDKKKYEYKIIAHDGKFVTEGGWRFVAFEPFVAGMFTRVLVEREVCDFEPEPWMALHKAFCRFERKWSDPVDSSSLKEDIAELRHLIEDLEP